MVEHFQIKHGYAFLPNIEKAADNQLHHCEQVSAIVNVIRINQMESVISEDDVVLRIARAQLPLITA